MNKYDKKLNNLYYIHFHAKNIRGGIGGSNNILSLYNDQRENAITNSKKVYSTLFKENLSQEAQTLINTATEYTEEEMIKLFHDSIAEQTQKMVNSDKLAQLMRIRLASTNKDNLSILLKGGKESLDEFNKLLHSIGEATKLLEGPDAQALALVLCNTTFNKGMTKTVLGNNLYSALSRFRAKNDKTVFSPDLDKNVQKVLGSLDNLAYALKNGKFKTSGGKVTPAGLKTLLDNNLFSTSLAETIAVSAVDDGVNQIAQGIIDATAGTENSQLVITDDAGNCIHTGNKITGKVDIKLSDMDVQVDSLGTSVKLTTGISNKFYSSVSFPDLNGKIKGTISLGSGGSLKEAFYALFGADVNKNYIAYNIISHSELTSENQLLNDLILKRQVGRIFSTTGSAKDFASMILINGKIFSMWDILDYVYNNFLGKSASQKGGNEAIQLSVNGRPQIYSAASTWEGSGNSIIGAWQRSKKTNEAINSATITAKMHINKLIDAFENN